MGAGCGAGGFENGIGDRTGMGAGLDWIGVLIRGDTGDGDDGAAGVIARCANASGVAGILIGSEGVGAVFL